MYITLFPDFFYSPRWDVGNLVNLQNCSKISSCQFESLLAVNFSQFGKKVENDALVRINPK